MVDNFGKYMEWIDQNAPIWAAERPAKLPQGASPLRELHAVIMQALEAIPRFVHPSARIHDGALVEGNVVIEDGAQVLPGAIVHGPAFIGRRCVVGNHTLLRASCFLACDSLAGNHCYCNEAVVCASSRVAHFVHFSRSIASYNSTVSAFVITATVRADRAAPADPGRSGSSSDLKRGCTIGANSFIAPHVLLLPGIDVGHNCFVGSFSVISRDIPDHTFVETVRPFSHASE